MRLAAALLSGAVLHQPAVLPPPPISAPAWPRAVRCSPLRCPPVYACDAAAAPPPAESTASFDDALAGMLADAESLGSADAAVDAWLDRLDDAFIPTLGSRLEAAEGAAVPPPNLLAERALMVSLQTRSQAQFERARDQLQALLSAGEIRKMDTALAKLVKANEVDAGLFYVLYRNMEAAREAGEEDDVRVLSHLHTRLQEELEKQTEPALALLHKLTRTDDAGIRANVLSHYLLPQSVLLLPDLKSIPLDPPRPALVKPLALAGAIEGALEKVAALPVDRKLIEATAEDIRGVAKEAHAVVAANYPAEVLEEFQTALTPAFSKLLPGRVAGPEE